MDQATTTSCKILAVDDEEEILRLYHTFLKYRGYEVVTVRNAEACVDFLMHDRPDVILLDINMPGVDGLTLLEIIKTRPSAKDTPIIMVTAQGDEASVKKAVALGCDNYIVKPFKLEDLARRINAEIYRLDHDGVCRLLERAKDLRTRLIKDIGAKEFNGIYWDPYYAKDGETEVCVMVPRGVRPNSLLKLNSEELRKRVAVFFKYSVRWKKAWPI